MQLKSDHSSINAELKQVETLVNNGQTSEAFSKLAHVNAAIPAHDLSARDKVTNWFLDFAAFFVQHKNYEDALKATQLAQRGTLLYAHVAEEATAYVDGLRETERRVAEATARLKAAKNSQDLDALATVTEEIQRYNGLDRNRYNPFEGRNTNRLDYPRFVHLETLAVCNAACSFCPYPSLERQGTRMSDQLIEKIIDDLAEIPPHVGFQIAPYKVSDPFIEKRLIDIIQLINEKLPNAQISLISNGAAMTEKVLTQLTKLKNIAYLKVSLNDHRKEEYEKLMSLPFAKTLDRLDMLTKLVDGGHFSIPVSLNRVMEGSRHDIEFLEFCNERFPHFTATLSSRNDWIGNVDEMTSMPSVPDVACWRWHNISITATGEVALCCMDGHGQWSIGDVNQNSVLEIFNSEKFRTLREHVISRRDAETPCNACTYI